MAEIQYKLDVFEGPMDLLLYLIAKHKLNIYDIPIFELVEQYTAYIRAMQETDLEIASEFLEMAARLVHIKSVSLLPVHEEGEQLRRELSGELIEYAACKKAAAELSTHTDGFNCCTRGQEKLAKVDMTYRRIHDPIELLDAYMRVIGNKFKKLPPSFDVFRPLVAKKIVSVSDKIRRIVRFLADGGKRTFMDILKASESRSDMVAAFLAVLELTKTKHIRLTDGTDDFGIELVSMPEGDLDFD